MVDGGYTPAQIRRFVLADVNDIYEGWSETPPVRTMVAAYLGIKPKTKAEAPAVANRTTIATLKAMFPNGGIMGG